MAVEIIRHSASGELYAVQYSDDGYSQNLSTVARVCGPLTAAEAVEAFDDGDIVNSSDDDLPWIQGQPWTVIPATGMGITIDGLRERI